MGPAQRSQFYEASLPAAVSFSVPAHVEGLSNSFLLHDFELNPPEVYLTQEKLKTHQNTVQERQKKPAAPDAKSPTRCQHPYEPTDSQILIQAHLIMSAHPETYKPVSQTNFDNFLKWLRVELNWVVNESRVKTLLLPRARFVSMGQISVDAVELAVLDHKEKVFKDTTTPPVRNTKQAKEPEEPWTEESEKRHKEAEKLVRKRLVLPKPSIYDLLDRLDSFKQKEGAVVKMIFHEDRNDRSYMRLRFTHMYKDISRPKEQPSHKTDVDLTYRNTRPRGHLPKPHGDVYEASERIMDVSDRKFIPLLARLFPHLARDDNRYWEKLFYYGLPLNLLQLRQNELAMTNNVFTPRVDVPASYQDLRIIMRHAPIIYVLIRGDTIDKITDSIISRLGKLARFDPLSRFFKDIQNPFINNKGIKATEDLPKFTTLPESAFEDWREYSVHCGVGTIIELRYGMSTQIHQGSASAHPVPHTQYINGNKSIDMSLFLNFVEEQPNRDIPRLAVGDLVDVDFNFDRIQSKHVWKGRVVYPTISTGKGQICIVADRPYNAEDGILDMKPYTALTAKQMDKMTAEELCEWASTNRNLRITVTRHGNEKECKRLCNGLSKMVAPGNLQPGYERRERILLQFRTLLMCKDHSQYNMSSLFETLHEEDRDRILTALRGSLLDYQMGPVNHWLNKGVTSNIVALGGISGSGKTFTSISVLCGYTFKVRIDREKRAMQGMDLVRLINGQATKTDQDNSKSAKSDVPVESGAAEDDGDDDDADFLHTKDLMEELYDDSGDPTQEFEDGRVTHVSIQNETVDHNYETWCSRLHSICEKTGAPPKLVVRLHSVQSEWKALLAMIDSSFIPSSSPDPKTIRRNPELSGTTNVALLEHYLRMMRNEHPGITDKRFHAVQGSVAYVILQLARLSGIPLSNEVASTWTEQERDGIAEKLSMIHSAYEDCQADGKISKATEAQVKRAFRIGYHVVITRASVVCSTLAVATTSSFQIYRKAHAIALEEAGRAIDLDIAALLSTHWACDLIMLVGDWRQLAFSPYGPDRDNPFQSQLCRSPFSRLNDTGFPIQSLTHTARFTSDPLLLLCRRLNNEPLICAVPGSFSVQREIQAKQINKKIWGKESVIVVLNTENAVAMRDANGSWYSIQTAIATMHDMVHRLKQISGDSLMVITPYNAQLGLLLALRDAAYRNALASRDQTLADQLTKVMIITVDSSMGKDREHVVLDSVGNAEGFLWRQPRTLVAGTRARTSFVFVGPTYHYTSKSHIKDRLKDMLYVWNSEDLSVTLNDTQLSKLEQYQAVRTALKIVQKSSNSIPRSHR